MIPLEKARLNKETLDKKVCCSVCKNRTVFNKSNFCEVSGKMILDMHLDVTREEQCKERFRREK